MRSWALGTALAVGLTGCEGPREGPGTIEGGRLPASAVEARDAARARAAPPDADKQILFGDLHVHTTISADAFLMSLPILQGEGAHPVADACDYARFCSGLDFWSINDHAESITPRRWQETKQSIRQCNALAGSEDAPDVVAFLGWEWTQVGTGPEDHYGHKNVIFRALDEERVPRRAIHSDSFAFRAMRRAPPRWQSAMLPLLDWPNRGRYFGIQRLLRESRAVPPCAEGVDTRELPDACLEGAATPAVLFEKLAQWGHDSIVIPHGTSWGLYTPAGSSWDNQLVDAQHDPERQTLIEVFSGHGNSEEHRDWRAVAYDADGKAVCPEPTPDYEPCCWRAGEIIRSRCEDPASVACAARVADARANFLHADVTGRHTVPGATLADWKDCGQCRDCFLPSYNHRPGGSVQYILAVAGAKSDPSRFDVGFLASSDNHSARPGTGYKEFGRLTQTDARGPRDAGWYRRFNGDALRDPTPESVRFDRFTTELPAYVIMDFERQASFFMTGGLAAVHASGRGRDAIWSALERREVYGTSGERILLWFDLQNGAAGPAPMGSRVALAEPPRFRVRAVGSRVQRPGCPDASTQGLSAERLGRLCGGECYNPGDARHPIDRIEVVRIQARRSAEEPVASAIDDPWRTLACAPDPAGCTVEFTDPDYDGRPHVYYVRAIQPATPAVNAGHLRCREVDANGGCVAVEPCYGDYRTPADDDCLAPSEERAWSSPIYVWSQG